MTLWLEMMIGNNCEWQMAHILLGERMLNTRKRETQSLARTSFLSFAQ